VAVVHSYRQYRKDRVEESAEAVAAAAEHNVVAEVADGSLVADGVGGRPSAPRD
jgi:hypothetical protein